MGRRGATKPRPGRAAGELISTRLPRSTTSQALHPSRSLGAPGFLRGARLPPGPTSVIGEPGWCVLHQSLASRRVLNFIGSTSGPLTMKWPLISRMVSVVIALPYPNPLRRSHKRDRTPMNIGSTLCDAASDPGNKPRRVLAGFFMCGACPNLPPRAGPPGASDSLPLTPKHHFISS